MNTRTTIVRQNSRTHRAGLLKLLLAGSLAITGLNGLAMAQQDQTQQDPGQLQQDPSQFQQGQGGGYQGGGFQGGGRGGRRQQQQGNGGGAFGGAADPTGGGGGNGGNGGGRRGGRRGGRQQGGGFGNQGQFGGYNGGGGFGAGGQSYPNPTRALTGNDYTDLYGDIAQHNIFMANRNPPPARQYTTLQLTAEQSWFLTGIVLENGEYHAYAENLNQPGSAPIQFKVNDAIAQGKVAEITIDQMAYEHNGEKTWVRVGSDLTGNQSNGSTARISTLGATQAGSGGFLGNNGGALNTAGNNNRGFNPGGGFNNPNNAFNGAANGFGGGGRGGRRGGGAVAAVPAPPPPPLPGGDAANLSIEERMKLRRLSDLGAVPSSALPPGAAEPPPPAPTPDTPAAATPDAPIVPNAGNLSVEEQMQLRRQQQLSGN